MKYHSQKLVACTKGYIIVFYLFNVLKLALRGLTHRDCFLSFSISGHGIFFVKNTGRGVVWVEKRCFRSSLHFTKLTYN